MTAVSACPVAQSSGACKSSSLLWGILALAQLQSGYVVSVLRACNYTPPLMFSPSPLS